ncbi:tripartite motif-containing protein 45-like isoform X2 [Photinus pyralis]|uniref:tripartite motif-containing protein 45-like isoform X2 n=1 Tax=Photinus pyralis TaxID=7054 RepID=UPI0012676A21|nr:tripartite motif-containing protein 45-like isoform X2 [Photinus pyralis]XP_031343758.1 tripartite motif-containing protein 45-like isoform X2 [Photinus pyralis]
MMEVDHISYIFGSFSRRRSQEVGAMKRRSLEAPKISHDRSNSAPQHTSKKMETSSSRTKSMCGYKQDDNKFRCPFCKHFFEEPRVLPCLHTFCTKCLETMEKIKGGVEVESETTINVQTEELNTRQDPDSEGSGYGSDKCEVTRDNRTRLICRMCGIPSPLPPEGVRGLPLHYLIQHRMILATLNSSSTQLLCDFCLNDVLAIYRCTNCAYNLCDTCAEASARQKCSKHEILHLDDARKRGISRVRRQIMCSEHPDRELEVFCSTCCQVICRDCTSASHKGHMCELASRAAKSFTVTMRKALERVRNIAKETIELSTRLQGDSKRIQSRCDRVKQEVERYMDVYLSEIERHRQRLCDQIQDAQRENLDCIAVQQAEIQRRLRDAKEVVIFTDDLLTEGTDVELLSFVRTLLKRLERYSELELSHNWKVPDNLQFLPDEIAKDVSEDLCPIYGVITTQTVSPQNCVLQLEGLENIRIGKKMEVTLETYDSSNEPLQRGGETVIADLRHRDAGISRSVQVKVEDNRNGTYNLKFTPDVAGQSISDSGQNIKATSWYISLLHILLKWWE